MSLVIRKVQVKTTSYHFTPIRMAIQKMENNKCWWRCGEIGTLVHCWWECKMVQPLWRIVWQFCQKVNVKVLWSQNYPVIQQFYSLGIYPNEMKARTKTDTCTLMFTAALFTIAKGWKQPKCPSTDEWMNKMWPIHTMKCYSAIIRNEILTHLGHYANWRHKRTNIIWFHLHEVPRIGKFTVIESRIEVTRGWGKRRVGSYCLPFSNRAGLLFGMI